MVFGKSRLELKVGAFVLAGIVILAILVLLIGNFKTWGSTQRIHFIFNFVNGVKVGAPIRFAGVDVGEVKNIQFFFSEQEESTKVKISGLVKKEALIPADSEVWVNTLGLLGEKYLEIMPGSDHAHFIGNDQELIGNDPVAMHEIGEIAKNIADNVNGLINKIQSRDSTIGRLINDDVLYNELLRISQDADAMVRGLGEFTDDIKAHPWKLFYKPKTRK